MIQHPQLLDELQCGFCRLGLCDVDEVGGLGRISTRTRRGALATLTDCPCVYGLRGLAIDSEAS